MDVQGCGEGVHYHMTESHPIVLAVVPGAACARVEVRPRAHRAVAHCRRFAPCWSRAGSRGARQRGPTVRPEAAIEQAARERHQEDQVRTEETAAELLRTVKQRR